MELTPDQPGSRIFSEEGLLQDHSDHLSRTILGIDWERFFPYQLNTDISVELSDLATCSQFLGEHWASIQAKEAPSAPFITEALTEKKQRYYQIAADCFVFKQKAEVLGVFIGSVSDWSTYYLRYAWLHPRIRRHGYYRAFLQMLIQACQSGSVERIEADVSPSNLPSQLLYNQLQFNPSGFVISERWGTLTRLTRFLVRANEQRFVELFCAGYPYQLGAHSKTRLNQAPERGNTS